jgi:hypothetical protein
MRSGSRSQAESQFDVQDSATRDECEAAGGAQVQDPAVSNRKTTEKGEQHAKRKIDEAPFIIAFVGFWRDSGGDRRVSANRPASLCFCYRRQHNVVFVENYIVIDRPANEIFDFVSTPGNVYKWFTKSSDAKPFITGALDHPNRVGDQVFENIDFPDGRKLSLVQTTLVCIPGFEWAVTGQPIGSDGKPLPQVLSLAVWTVQSLPGGKSMFSRFFSLVGSEGSVTVSRSKNGALDPVGSQAALERLKKYLEGSQEKN